MNKLSKILLTIAITVLVSITFVPQTTKAETSNNSDNVDVKELDTITLQTAYNKLMDLTLDTKKKVLTPQKRAENRIMSDSMKSLEDNYKINSNDMLKILFGGRSKSLLYQAQYKAQMDRLNKLNESFN